MSRSEVEALARRLTERDRRRLFAHPSLLLTFEFTGLRGFFAQVRCNDELGTLLQYAVVDHFYRFAQ